MESTHFIFMVTIQSTGVILSMKSSLKHIIYSLLFITRFSP